MKRRAFLKSMGALGATGILPSIFTDERLIKSALAAPAYQDVNFIAPSVLPQVINVFLYGGPSELAGNLTNIDDINFNSQNPYPSALLQSLADGGQITPNGFWAAAGGNAMEEMLAAGEMSVYRTINRLKNNTRAHGQSVQSGLMGSLDIENSPGMGTTLAATLYQNRAAFSDGSLGGRQIEDLVLPFVSFEGTTTAFRNDPNNQLPLSMRGMSLDTRFDNPYSRGSDNYRDELEALISKTVPNSGAVYSRYNKIIDSFETRRRLEGLIDGFRATMEDAPLPMLPTDDPDAGDDGRLVYPNNGYTGRIRAAVTLALANPDSLFITIGGGLGGWDDHNAAIDEYVPRINSLMTTIRAAMKHIRYSDIDEGGTRKTDNIIINVWGEFGRNVNLNNSMGWDHGNNMNLYTFGGAAVRGQGALGKVVGKTERFGDSKQNRQFTRPTDDSYQCEPLSIAASVYSYFGVQNPQALTRDPEFYPQGVTAINENVAGEAPTFA